VGIGIKALFFFFLFILFIGQSCVNDPNSQSPFQDNGFETTTTFENRRKETLAERNEKMEEADFFRRVKDEGLAVTINSYVSPPRNPCPEIVVLDTRQIKDDQFVDGLIEQAYLQDKSCRSVFTGNAGGYSDVKKSYTRIFAYSMIQDICAPVGRDQISQALQLPKMGTQDALGLKQFNNGAKSEASMDNLITTYSLTYALGQRESDGNFREGRDITAQNKSLKNEESGLTQTSANSLELNASFPLQKTYLKDVFRNYVTQLSTMTIQKRENFCLTNQAKYLQGPKLHELFNDGDCSKILGTIKSDDYPVNSAVSKCFRELHKQCPSFSIKYGASVTRIDRRHNGPLYTHEELVNKGLTARKYAKPYMKPSCHSLFNSIAVNKEKICQQINN